MTDSALVSIIVPIYNAARFIDNVMGSIAKQDYENYEVIFIDDGSTDNSVQKIRDYDSSTVKIFSKKNEGPAKARNFGILQATGKFVAFHDADDAWHRSKLSKQVALFQTRPSLGLVFSNAHYVVMDSGKVMGESIPSGLDANNITKELMTRGCFILTSSVIIRRDALLAVGMFDDSLIFAEDWDLFFRISERYEVDYVREVLLEQRAHRSSITSDESKRHRRIQDERRVVDKMYSYASLYGLTEKDKKKMLQKLLLFNAERCLFDGNRALVRKYLSDAFLLNPLNGAFYKLYAHYILSR
ncbi:MAG TPA: glycosyltransferase family A protein [Dissulfurispiraceae bacterium]|nr:glycosyltransferase family A protein [Dissulfurispiraceae bacterium]